MIGVLNPYHLAKEYGINSLTVIFVVLVLAILISVVIVTITLLVLAIFLALVVPGPVVICHGLSSFSVLLY
jgi:hypothetical protein